MQWNRGTKIACALAATALYFSAAIVLQNSYAPPAPPLGEKVIALKRPFGSIGAFGVDARLPELKSYADETDRGGDSPILLYEGDRLLGPSHQAHGEIAKLGQGRYDHWNGDIVFSSSDGTNPASNGRSYWAVLPRNYVPPTPPPGEKAIRLGRPFDRFGTFGASVPLPEFAHFADATDRAADSPILLYEDGRLLGPAHQTHDEIARLGHGRYDHWKGLMVFSSSDGTDPVSNGRAYWAVLPRK